MQKKYVLLGVIAFLLTVVVGAILQPGYSHVANTISELTVTGAKNKQEIGMLFEVFSICLMFYGWLCYRQSARSKRFRVIGMCIVSVGLISFLLTMFPVDSRNVLLTPSGVAHLILTGALTLAALVASALFARAHQQERQQPRLTVVAWIFFAWLLVTSAVTWIAFVQTSHVVGLFERLTIGGFLAWLMFFSRDTKSITIHNEMLWR